MVNPWLSLGSWIAANLVIQGLISGPILRPRNGPIPSAIRMVGISLGVLSCTAIFIMISRVSWQLLANATINASSVDKAAVVYELSCPSSLYWFTNNTDNDAEIKALQHPVLDPMRVPYTRGLV